MITVEDIRNPARQSGFDHVATHGPRKNRKVTRYRASVGRHDVPSAQAWFGRTRCTPEEAAQDYCDYMNGRQGSATATLNNAGHGSKREALSDNPEVIAALGVLRDARGQREGRPGFVYCITDGEYLKIGYSTKPEARIGELQSGNARKLALLGTIPAPDHTDTERALHQKYIQHNVLGEWFEPTSEILSEFGLTEQAIESKVTV